MKGKKARVWSAIILGFFSLLALMSVGQVRTSTEPYTLADTIITIGLLVGCWILGFFSGKEQENERRNRKSV
jgi:hypothetical protein